MNSSIAILARRAARKSKGMLVAITLLSTLGVGLLLCGTIAADDFPSAFDAQSARLNTEDLQFSTPSDRLAQSLVENLKRDQRVAVTETQPVLQERASFTFAQNDLSLTVTYLDLDAMGTSGKQAIVESARPSKIRFIYRYCTNMVLDIAWATASRSDWSMVVNAISMLLVSTRTLFLVL